MIQNLDPKIFKAKNQFIIDAIQFYIDNYGKETFVIKKKEKMCIRDSMGIAQAGFKRRSISERNIRICLKR